MLGGLSQRELTKALWVSFGLSDEARDHSLGNQMHSGDRVMIKELDQYIMDYFQPLLGI